MSATTYYKFLDADGRGQYSGYPWPPPAHGDDGAWEPGAWVEVAGELVPCKHGLHAVADLADLPRWLNVALYALEYAAPPEDAGDKVVGRKARLVRPLGAWGLDAIRAWAVDVAEHALPVYERARPGDTRVRACLDTTRRHLRGAATRDEVRAAARAARAAGHAAYAVVDAAAAADAAAYAAADATADAAAAAAYAADAAYGATYAGDAAAYAAAAANGAAAARAAARAAGAIERRWQGARLLAYANGEVRP